MNLRVAGSKLSLCTFLIKTFKILLFFQWDQWNLCMFYTCIRIHCSVCNMHVPCCHGTVLPWYRVAMVTYWLLLWGHAIYVPKFVLNSIITMESILQWNITVEFYFAHVELLLHIQYSAKSADIVKKYWKPRRFKTISTRAINWVHFNKGSTWVKGAVNPPGGCFGLSYI